MIIDGRKLVHEKLLDTAAKCAQAAFKAPQTTGRLKLQVEVLTQEQEMLPIVEMFEVLGEIQPHAIQLANGYRKLFEAGEPPVIILFGADLTVSEMGWDCGACGFKTCAEFNKYAKQNRNFGVLGQGPSCNWKVLDFGTACSWACAAASQYNVENRIAIFEGAFANMLGYVDGVSYILALPLVSCRELWFYSRPAIDEGNFSYEWWQDYIRNFFPATFMPFATPSSIPRLKTRQDWEQDMGSPRWVIPKEDPEITRKRDEVLGRFMELAGRKAAEVAEMRKKLKK